ncbi:MAG: hypothetical protein K9M02_09220 [Thiohalocapsa sp.]|nr:hypothetical protein [Thiohalocapsa sp.]
MRYDALIRQTWRDCRHPASAPASTPAQPALIRELVRCAVLAPSSHNTQCWRFEPRADGIRVRPDLSRRCPAVDPDDHHLYLSVGCAVENLQIAARAQGLAGEATLEAWPAAPADGDFDGARRSERMTGSATGQETASQRDLGTGIGTGTGTRAGPDCRGADGTVTCSRVALTPDQPRVSPLYQAIPRRQLGSARAHLVVRFGRGPEMPRSLRRPLHEVIDD